MIYAVFWIVVALGIIGSFSFMWWLAVKLIDGAGSKKKKKNRKNTRK